MDDAPSLSLGRAHVRLMYGDMEDMGGDHLLLLVPRPSIEHVLCAQVLRTSPPAVMKTSLLAAPDARKEDGDTPMMTMWSRVLSTAPSSSPMLD